MRPCLFWQKGKIEMCALYATMNILSMQKSNFSFPFTQLELYCAETWFPKCDLSTAWHQSVYSFSPFNKFMALKGCLISHAAQIHMDFDSPHECQRVK
jgi:hypothetical protein